MGAMRLGWLPPSLANIPVFEQMFPDPATIFACYWLEGIDAEVTSARGFSRLESRLRSRIFKNTLLSTLLAGNSACETGFAGLRTPPRIPTFGEISRRMANGPELAAHGAGA
jgi:hypothetical protein